MCGICGQWGGASEQRDACVRSMTTALAHRGPDDEGYFSDAFVSLGHRRLSIIDPATGQQPLASSDGRVQTIVNGEIYNFRELRADLEQKHGAAFRTHSDSETLVHLYKSLRHDWRADAPTRFLEQLNGMFAFALWDADAKRLFLARDRLGQKPLYYHTTPGGGLVFASELSAFIEASVPDNVTFDTDALWHYLKYGYIPAPLTFYKEIRCLPPAHFLLADESGIQIERYWTLPETGDTLDGSDASLVEQLGGLLTDAVRMRLVSDVPLGAFLSGGLDSSLIAALMGQAGHEAVKTFCVGFDDGSYDERDWAAQVAAHLHTEHQAETVTPDPATILPQLVRHFGQPFGDSSAVNVWHLSRMTRAHVTVALSGDGADELFGGYRRYLGRARSIPYLTLPKPLRRMAEGFLHLLPDPQGYYGRSWIKKARLFSEQVRRLEQNPSDVATPAFSEEMLSELLLTSKPEHDLVVERAYQHTATDPVNQMMRTDIETYLPDDILTKVDRMSMAHGLEVRSPFLDHRVVEFACRLPLRMKLRGNTGKWILRELAKTLLPNEILKRPKHGFMVPLDRWMRSELQETTKAAVQTLDPRWIRQDKAMQLFQTHHTARRDHGHRLWVLMMLRHAMP